jgi:hypothetical protein
MVASGPCIYHCNYGDHVVIVGVNAGWKAPVAYFLTNTLSASTQKELVVHLLTHLTENGFLVHCLTLDGHASNLSMCRLLGADLGSSINFRSWFTIPDTQQQVFVLLDPCHMIKLARNMLHAYGGIRSTDGLIEWRYISELQNVQQEIGWRLGNRLTSRHINFHQNKMKVYIMLMYLHGLNTLHCKFIAEPLSLFTIVYSGIYMSLSGITVLCVLQCHNLYFTIYR